MQPAEGPARSLAAAPQGWDRLPLPALELSSDAHALEANAAMAALAGMPAPALLGTGWFAALSPDRRAALFAALSAQQDFSLPIRLLRHDGVKAWVDLDARWLPQSGSFLCLLQDRTALHQAVQDAQALSARFELLADNLPVLIAYYESAGFTCLYANRHYASTFGLEPPAVIGKTFAQVIGDDAAREIQPHVDLMLKARRTVSYMRQMPAAQPGGRPRWLEVSLVPHLASDGHPFGSFVLISDITRHREAEAAVRESEERMAKFMQASLEGIVFHHDGLITDLNEPMAALVGGTREELLGRHVLDFVSPNQLARVQQVMTQGAELSYETEIVDLQGRVIPVEFLVRTMLRGGTKLRMTVVRDIRDRQAQQARIRQLAHHDTLTGLLNRGAFVERLEAELAHPPADGRSMALMFIDLDHFKRINDSLGHGAGDALLRAVGQRIADALPAVGAAGRFGGDEFVVLLPGIADRREAALAAERLRAAVQAPVAFAGRQLAVTPTVGVALFPEHGRDADTLLRHADAALYAGKAAGRDAVTVFEPALGAAIDEGLKLEAELAAALERGEFALRLQPRLRVADGGPALVEALLCWNHPQRGPLAPSAFAHRAQPRLLQPLAAWALREALTLQRSWQAAGHGALPVLLSLGSLQLDGPALLAALGHALAAQAAAPGTLMLALDERQCAAEGARLPRLLAGLQRLGVAVTLEGLGAGGLSIVQLRDLPFAGWSLDASLVNALPHDRASAAVVRSLIGLAHELGRVVAAGGVDHAAQRDWLGGAGCTQLQGEAIEPARAPAALLAWLATQHPAAAAAATSSP
ncbi:putative bifunctional diguanylate cyclase/phosphodiesterase [Aquabacterium humicola]|uniref:putative bifunctional diguanylate cyclase/phosphodiesterase n=1 Tax=Aquabacterium humicola TaxID=3237377 RepID=UPI002542EFDF|nr:diguanylate cyclase [Rubrivivax pictus]